MSQLKSSKQLGKGFHFELAHSTIKSGSRCGKEWPNISEKLQHRKAESPDWIRKEEH